MIRLQVALDALGAEHPAIEREILPRLEADHVIFANLQLDAALLPAEAAMRLYQPVRWRPRLLAPAAFGSVVQMRSVLLAKLFQRSRAV